jgi:site-specific recombinase XerC
MNGKEKLKRDCFEELTELYLKLHPRYATMINKVWNIRKENAGRNRLERLIRECGWSSLGKISSDSFTNWRAGLQSMSARTKNQYLAEAKTFLNWMILQGRMAVNPLASVSKVDQTVKTRVRRALTNAELASLFKHSPHYRRVPYLMSAKTGLRYGELSELIAAEILLCFCL